LAMDYRREFATDVVIDLFCFRRYGHNEADEPSFTEPLLYKKIEQHPPLPSIYGRKLVEEGVVPEAEVERMLGQRTRELEADFTRARAQQERPRIRAGGGFWAGF